VRSWEASVPKSPHIKEGGHLSPKDHQGAVFGSTEVSTDALPSQVMAHLCCHLKPGPAANPVTLMCGPQRPGGWESSLQEPSVGNPNGQVSKETSFVRKPEMGRKVEGGSQGLERVWQGQG
jgi:hypothetical protein